MWYIRKPTADFFRQFVAQQQEQAFSYREVGLSRDGMPASFDNDHNRVQLGKGSAVFGAGCAAIRRWEMFPAPWTIIEPRNAPIRKGQTVVMLARIFSLWWPNAARIVYTLDETEPVRRFGFAYGTLPKHVEQGEERFSVEWLADDTVWYDLRAFSRPTYWPARLCYPLTRRLQRRFVRESLAAMQRAVAKAATET